MNPNAGSPPPDNIATEGFRVGGVTSGSSSVLCNESRAGYTEVVDNAFSSDGTTSVSTEMQNSRLQRRSELHGELQSRQVEMHGMQAPQTPQFGQQSAYQCPPLSVDLIEAYAAVPLQSMQWGGVCPLQEQLGLHNAVLQRLHLVMAPVAAAVRIKAPRDVLKLAPLFASLSYSSKPYRGDLHSPVVHMDGCTYLVSEQSGQEAVMVQLHLLGEQQQQVAVKVPPVLEQQQHRQVSLQGKMTELLDIEKQYKSIDVFSSTNDSNSTNSTNNSNNLSNSNGDLNIVKVESDYPHDSSSLPVVTHVTHKPTRNHVSGVQQVKAENPAVVVTDSTKDNHILKPTPIEAIPRKTVQVIDQASSDDNEVCKVDEEKGLVGGPSRVERAPVAKKAAKRSVYDESSSSTSSSEEEVLVRKKRGRTPSYEHIESKDYDDEVYWVPSDDGNDDEGESYSDDFEDLALQVYNVTLKEQRIIRQTQRQRLSQWLRTDDTDDTTFFERQNLQSSRWEQLEAVNRHIYEAQVADYDRAVTEYNTAVVCVQELQRQQETGELEDSAFQTRQMSLRTPPVLPGKAPALTFLRATWLDGEVRGGDVCFPGGLYCVGETYDKLLPYQREGVQWLWDLFRHKTGGILADEMGLGKTVQVAVLQSCLEYTQRLHRNGTPNLPAPCGVTNVFPVLLVCPAGVLSHWVSELHVWCPRARVFQVPNPTVKAEAVISQAFQYCYVGMSIVVVSYSALLTYPRQTEQKWSYVVLDEGHKIKNDATKTSMLLNNVLTRRRLALTGTPVQNSLRELWPQMDWLKPGQQGDKASFEHKIVSAIERGSVANADAVAVRTAIKCARMVRALIQPAFLQRKKLQVASALPKKKEDVIFTELTAEQYTAYRRATTQARYKSWQVLGELNKVCNHSDQSSPPQQPPNSKLLKLCRQDGVLRAGLGLGSALALPWDTLGHPLRSSKQLVLLQALRNWHVDGHRCLLFSQSVQMLNFLEQAVKAEGYRYSRLDGSTSLGKRARMVADFNNNDEVFVFLLTTRAGGLGLNLIGADRVVIFDPDWNPAIDAQAKERCYRLGQTRPVAIYHLAVGGSLEQRIIQRQAFKNIVATGVIEGGEGKRIAVEEAELKELLVIPREPDPRDVIDKVQNVCKAGVKQRELSARPVDSANGSEAQLELIPARNEVRVISNRNSSSSSNSSSTEIDSRVLHAQISADVNGDREIIKQLGTMATEPNLLAAVMNCKTSETDRSDPARYGSTAEQMEADQVKRMFKSLTDSLLIQRPIQGSTHVKKRPRPQDPPVRASQPAPQPQNSSRTLNSKQTDLLARMKALNRK